ncbi:hypothetical protein [Mesomycoplasma hyorhinis]|uniref:hypothetical protein n=1 Tax=Mesomycoplasma hyorhinis TaxID=2100 RepID=UPI001C043D2C|nr:hypothetical protein [Mesomycoplasma hyorhinis]
MEFTISLCGFLYQLNKEESGWVISKTNISLFFEGFSESSTDIKYPSTASPALCFPPPTFTIDWRSDQVFPSSVENLLTCLAILKLSFVLYSLASESRINASFWNFLIAGILNKWTLLVKDSSGIDAESCLML